MKRLVSIFNVTLLAERIVTVNIAKTILFAVVLASFTSPSVGTAQSCPCPYEGLRSLARPGCVVDCLVVDVVALFLVQVAAGCDSPPGSMITHFVTASPAGAQCVSQDGHNVGASGGRRSQGTFKAVIDLTAEELAACRDKLTDQFDRICDTGP